jgi:hypothetical protein
MGLHDRLRARPLPTETVRIPVDPEAAATAERDLDAAAWALEEARTRGSADLAELRARAAATRAAVDGLQYESVTLRGLPPAEWEALIDQHPPPEDGARPGAQWNPATFRPALLAACVVPADGEDPPSASDWEQIAKDGSLSAGELNTLFSAAVALNLRTPASAVGKGSSATRSSS